jgi:hypothetical protein
MRLFVSFATLTLGTHFFVAPAFAQGFDAFKSDQVPLLGKVLQYVTQNFYDNPLDLQNKTYQIGDEWGKKPVKVGDLPKEDRAFQRAARATAKAGGATSFYLGQFAGQHIMATNHHVFTRASQCIGGNITFPLLEKSFKCTGFLGSWPNIDLALFIIEVKSEQDSLLLKEVEANFDFTASLAKGTELMTIGFGIANNPTQVMVGNQDSDCKVFSEANDFRLTADPDAINPANYKAWSFVNGCDVSHGDSGSALVSKETGLPIGIIWTGKIPKDPQVQSTSFLENMLSTGSPKIWSELSFGVPASKMKEALVLVENDPNTPKETKNILADLLN